MEPNTKFDSLGIIIARTLNVRGDASQAIEIAKMAKSEGKDVGVFLVSDGVWNALGNPGSSSDTLIELVKDGTKLYLSNEHVRAAGMPVERVIEGAEFIEDTYGVLVENVMEKWDKVIIC